MTVHLTGADRRAIARARDLAAASGKEAVRAVTQTPPSDSPLVDAALVYAEGFGVARQLLGELAAIIGRLEAGDG